ncbi:hypothetical protein HC031_14785 [Planosporangium thailandense]|uniref:Uncharacterized protein n=1 Tax=Planosporangium thailandense TaxID=765197 RepID=A0ABX0Y0K5_9ACTN|nr:hypothetical protein [Planosporangium thailandense]NJC70970.1 hypothetical protein [Planosporangium thailandense]
MTSMKARHFAPVAPLHVLPAGPYATPHDCADALTDALRGVERGGYDELICAWLVQRLDVSTLRVIVSLIERVREAAIRQAVEDQLVRDPHPQPKHRHAGREGAPIPRQNNHPGYYGPPGNAGPGF